eukprot:3200078-Pyramimonas_sp.AAC.1
MTAQIAQVSDYGRQGPESEVPGGGSLIYHEGATAEMLKGWSHHLTWNAFDARRCDWPLNISAGILSKVSVADVNRVLIAMQAVITQECCARGGVIAPGIVKMTAEIVPPTPEKTVKEPRFHYVAVCLWRGWRRKEEEEEEEDV